ncbi:MAG TPA: hypothetical protein VJ385_00745 [Fibrobacteria bacterium]|nr:hypothetical protein [Fibrobacteria bacterium]
MHSRFPVPRFVRSAVLRSAALAALATALIAPAIPADTIKPLLFGPFFMNQVSVWGSPAGYDYVMTNGFYHFQVGWIEPLADGRKGLFGETYFETNGNLHVSPFTSDLGTTFNLKPIRYLEFGLSYNRLLYHNSLVSFARPGSDEKHPPRELYTPPEVLASGREVGGADVFTYQINFTLDMGRTQLYLFGSRQLWDVDAKGKDFVYEYGDDLLIRTRDRVNHANGVFSLDLRPWSLFRSVSFQGLEVRDRYWHSDHTELQKNLISFGITGFRLGRNPEHQRRGLDLSVGYWTYHDQIPEGDVAKSFMVIADWKWNIHFLKM